MPIPEEAMSDDGSDGGGGGGAEGSGRGAGDGERGRRRRQEQRQQQQQREKRRQQQQEQERQGKGKGPTRYGDLVVEYHITFPKRVRKLQKQMFEQVPRFLFTPHYY
jgi:hypothetical protein